MNAPTVQLRGMTWDHPRGYDPLVAASAAFAQLHPDVAITWEKRPLAGFEQTPLEELAARYDLMVIDHPHVGDAAASVCLLPFAPGSFPESSANAAFLAAVAAGSLGGSYESYVMNSQQWALPIDAAAQVSAWREGYREQAPADWDDVLASAQRGRMVWPLKPAHALMSFFSLCANRGRPCQLSGDVLIDADDAEPVLDAMIRLTELVVPASFEMDPIDASEAMAAGTADESPILYNYINYALPGFRQRRLTFGDMPGLSGDCRGSTLGGTGIAISNRTAYPQIAVAFALAVASSAWQRGIIFDNAGQPAHADAWNDPHLDDATGGFFSGTRATLDTAWIRPRFAGYIPFQHEAGELIVVALRRARSIVDTVNQLNERFAAAQRKAVAP